jgi:hypothetical protein
LYCFPRARFSDPSLLLLQLFPIISTFVAYMVSIAHKTPTLTPMLFVPLVSGLPILFLVVLALPLRFLCYLVSCFTQSLRYTYTLTSDALITVINTLSHLLVVISLEVFQVSPAISPEHVPQKSYALCIG